MEPLRTICAREIAENLRNSDWEDFLNAAALTDCERDHKILKEIRDAWNRATPISNYLDQANAEIEAALCSSNL